MINTLRAYLPEDRAHALAHGIELPNRAYGSALFADISGFTPLTEAFSQVLGARGGVEALSDQINAVYAALTAVVNHWRGSTISFSGDAITCWFDDSAGAAPLRAAACACALQGAMAPFTTVALQDGRSITLALKVAVATGHARRFAVGNPAIQMFDVLAGATLMRMAAGEHLARPGEILLDTPTIDALGIQATLGEQRVDPESGESFTLLRTLANPPAVTPWEPVQLPAEAIRPWVLPIVWGRHEAGLGAFLTELRPAVTLFLRFSGLDYEGDDEAGQRFDTLIRSMQSIFLDTGGTLLQITIGDKGSYLYASFGAPIAHEDDARRAVRAALALHAAAAELGLPPIQIGLSQGTLRCGAYGGPARQTYGVLGDDVNIAARLMARAAPGETMLSGRVLSDLGDSFSVEPRAPIPLKGKVEPLPVFILTGMARRRAMRLQEPAYALPLVGRDSELIVIQTSLERALSGLGQVVVIQAEAGMGKSRLIAEVVRLARRRGYVGYGGTATIIGAHTPYLVWRPIFQALLDIDPDAPLRRQLRQLASELAERVPERAEVLPLLDLLLERELPDNDFTAALAPQDRKGAREGLLLDLLQQEMQELRADGRAMLLIVEDAHWIDSLSSDLLVRIVQEAPGLPLLLVIATRSTALTESLSLASRPHATELTLDRLDETALADLVRAKLAQLFPARAGALPPGLVATLAARAQGNPFYVEELLSYLHNRGVMLDAPQVLAGLDLPDSLHRLVMARLDQLTEREQTTLRVASVIGRLFRASWLPGFAPELGELPRVKADLETLARLDLTPLDTPEPELAYLFKHVVTQEVAYTSLPRATRMRLHGALADWLEITTQEHPPLDLLAYHYDHSDRLDKRRFYLRRGGEAATAQYANAAAVDYLTRALVLAPDDDIDERWALLLTRESVYAVLGQREAQAADLETLATLASGDLTHEADVALLQAHYYRGIGDYQAAYTTAQHAQRRAETANDQHRQAKAYLLSGAALFRMNDTPRAKQELESALAIAQSTARRDLEVEGLALLWLSAIAAGESDHQTQHECLVASLRLSREAGDVLLEARALNNLSAHAEATGDYGRARAAAEQAQVLFHKMGNYEECSALFTIGDLAIKCGDYETAQKLLKQGAIIAQKSRNLHSLGLALGSLGDLALEQEDFPEAQANFQQLLDPIYAVDMRAYGLDGLGRTLASLGQFDEAGIVFQEALQIYRDISMPSAIAAVQAELAGVALRQGDVLRAREYVEPVMLYLETGDLGGTTSPMRTYRLCIDVLRTIGDARADTLLARAYNELQAIGSTLDKPARESYLERVPVNRQMIALWHTMQAGEL